MALNRDDSSPLFAGSVAGTLKLIVYLALACILMVLDHRGGWLANVRYGLSLVVEPVYRIAGLPSQGFHAATVAFADRQRLTESNQRLREDLLLANAKLNRMASVAEQNTRLKELLDTQHSLNLNVQLARLIGVDLGTFRHRIVLNVGARDQVKPGQVVIDARGVMGQVVDVMPTTSVAMLITDPNHAIPVTIERTGLRTIAYGSRAGDMLVLPNIPVSSDVREGDKLVTSGLGGRFPPGFPVGEIRDVAQTPSGTFLSAQARPAADLDRSEDVLLLHDLAEPAGPPPPAPVAGPPADMAMPAAPPAATLPSVTSPTATPVPARASTATTTRPAVNP
ncbi:rod shape-determining protein MreC [Luteibacter rhizovicinus]|uniref:Cell shape-determining protein MreC n=1 Tax=Luteibacter rhizovicinus TaxID=242606 RepID=A0A4R3YJM3_9GAMM|nr:rod shape-determining protein MreC [Luteibacter rhizovicinus]TCV91578.1 rod shape-determining protein MreC [Luteibacter rhizovicinus]